MKEARRAPGAAVGDCRYNPWLDAEVRRTSEGIQTGPPGYIGAKKLTPVIQEDSQGT